MRSREEGREQGVPVALEPIQREFAAVLDDRQLARRGGRADRGERRRRRPDVRLMAPLARAARSRSTRHRDRIRGVHLADWREPTRNTNDRVLPGDGVVDFAPILEALRWDGFYDLEIFSDPSCRARSGGRTRASWPRAGSRRCGGRCRPSLRSRRRRDRQPLRGAPRRVCEVSVLCRREEHARALNEHGLRVSGRQRLHGQRCGPRPTRASCLSPSSRSWRRRRPSSPRPPRGSRAAGPRRR